ncbi:MAP/microtubule affinity-regulating kinase 4-like [Talpa occidentalis]|uniref:MAP/microtubule affinity-regulating kinase 4-like n=1 Tax=Talpa occidentalis TaxID=50954 RepID=UPI0023F69D5D|nr:MAP/microtubule affinity-regulating kinase 4-like [Talpa occidentalis]XP_054552476.1 MAP/microtubule affinity-regulating kinase 4-like [Talpa occidentalis]
MRRGISGPFENSQGRERSEPGSALAMTKRLAPKEAKLKHYLMLRTLGEGSFSKVKLAQHARTGRKVAVKIMRKAKMPSREFLAREVGCMRALHHPNIVRLFEVVDTGAEVMLVMELAKGGDLEGYLNERGRLPESEARRIFRQVLSALSYCHSKGVAHRDLKPENLLMDDNGNIKLADFGLSVRCADEGLSTCCGSPEFLAPEIYLHQTYKGPTADVWSLGVTLYNMLTGELPFAGTSCQELRASVLSAHYYKPDYLSDQCRDLLSKMLVLDPQSRSTLESVIEHPWVQMKGSPPLGEPAGGHHGMAVMEAEVRQDCWRPEIVSVLAEGSFNDVMGTEQTLCGGEEEGEGQWDEGEGPSQASSQEHFAPTATQCDLDWEESLLQPEVWACKTSPVSVSLQEEAWERSFTSRPGPQLQNSTISVLGPPLEDAWGQCIPSMLGPLLEEALQIRTTSFPGPPMEDAWEHTTTTLPGSQLEGGLKGRSRTPSPAPPPSITSLRPPSSSGSRLLPQSNALAPAERQDSTLKARQSGKARVRRIISAILNVCCFCAPLHRRNHHKD